MRLRHFDSPGTFPGQPCDLREKVGRLVEEAEAVLRPQEKLDLKRLVRTFTLRTSDGFVENFGPCLLARFGAEAPGVRLAFVQKSDKGSGPLRDGSVDLETGVVGEATGPELRTQALFRDRFIGVVRNGHALSGGRGYAGPLRRRQTHPCFTAGGPEKAAVGIDDTLGSIGLEREIVTIVGGFFERPGAGSFLGPDRQRS
ncbi:LysR substrate-binding domain-containing protein [Sinorhizobium meliloti]|nr:LysR substrate-binding domain-containing protein [Sinorhizobium meliloti]